MSHQGGNSIEYHQMSRGRGRRPKIAQKGVMGYCNGLLTTAQTSHLLYANIRNFYFKFHKTFPLESLTSLFKQDCFSYFKDVSVLNCSYSVMENLLYTSK